MLPFLNDGHLRVYSRLCDLGLVMLTLLCCLHLAAQLAFVVASTELRIWLGPLAGYTVLVGHGGLSG